MYKRIIFYTITLILISAITFIVYIDNKPANVQLQQELIQYNINPLFDDKTIDKEIMDHEGAFNIVFFNSSDNKTPFLFNNLLSNILADYKLESFDNVVYCDLKDMDTAEITETKNRWGFFEYPALVNLEFKDGIINVNSALEWSATSNLSYSNIEKWLTDNEVISKSK